MSIQIPMQQLRGNLDVVTEKNPFLLDGQLIVLEDNDHKVYLKIGDGEHSFNELELFQLSKPSFEWNNSSSSASFEWE
jgi:hypothetical protein